MALAARAFADPAGASTAVTGDHVDDVTANETDAPTADTTDDADLGDLLDGMDTSETAIGTRDAGVMFIDDALATTSGLIDATSLHELEARHRRPSRWGWVDLAIAWRRIDRSDEPNEPSRRHEVFLIATWRN